MANGEGNGKKDDKGSGVGLAILGLGVLAAGAAALYFLTRKPSCPTGQQYDETTKTCIPVPPGGGGGGAATSIAGFQYSCSPAPCAAGSIIDINGRLLGAGGVPIAGATVRILVAGGAATANVTTDLSGLFTVLNPIVSSNKFTIQAVFDGDAAKGLAGATSPVLTVTPGSADCFTTQYKFSQPYMTQYVVDLGESILVTRIDGFWKKGGDYGTARLRAIFDDGSQIDLTGCVLPHQFGTVPLTTINKFTRQIRFAIAYYQCGIIPGYIDELIANVGTCKPAPPRQTCAAQGGTCGAPDRCTNIGGTAIPSTDCLQTCCKR